MTEEQLNELSIFSLREIARNAGVASPTSKKKSQLIQEIMEIAAGKREPYVAKTKQGRPPKNSNYSWIDVFKPNYQSSSSFLTLNQDTEPFNYESGDFTSGLVELINNNSAFLWIRKGLNFEQHFIPSSIFMQYKFKNGDLLMVELEHTEGQTLIKNVMSINGCPINKFNNTRPDYFDFTPTLPCESFKSQNNIDIQKGESIYLYGSNNNNNSTALINLMNSIECEYKIYINVSVAEKNKVFLSNAENCEMFVSSIMDDTETARRIVTLGIERAKRLFETGKNVLLVIDDALSISGLDDNNLTLTKKALSLSKVSENSSITTCAIMSQCQSISIFQKLADKKLRIVNDEILIMD